MAVKIDWLTLTIYGTLNPTHKHLRIEETEYKTRHFNKVSNVYFKDKKVGVLCYEPLSKILKSNLANLKIENEILYHENAHSFISDLAFNLGFVISGISRLDLCHDFNYFNRGLLPQKFIQGVFSQKYLKNGRGEFQNHGKIVPGGIQYNTLKYGDHSSRKSVYLYNKSLEMNQKKFKGHIYDEWLKRGLDVDNVWRLECSLKLSKGNIIDKETGEMFQINWKALSCQKFINRLYFTVINNNFSFKINKGTKNKTEMPDLILFKETQLNDVKNHKVAEVYTGCDNTRAEKIFINKLEKEQQKQNNEEIKSAIEFIKENCIREYSLRNWYHKKYGYNQNKQLSETRIESFKRIHKTGVLEGYTNRMNKLQSSELGKLLKTIDLSFS